VNPNLPPERAATDPGAGDQPLRAITRRMVAIYKEQFGRGPRHAHCHYAGPNAIACFLEQTFTPSERKLVELGEHQKLRETRLLFQYADEHLFRTAVEEVTGRPVVAFFSAIDAEADMAIETFVLGPAEPR
jgi:uncharacterized protein YbcI